jgi:hypothetical protein
MRHAAVGSTGSQPPSDVLTLDPRAFQAFRTLVSTHTPLQPLHTASVLARVSAFASAATALADNARHASAAARERSAAADAATARAQDAAVAAAVAAAAREADARAARAQLEDAAARATRLAAALEAQELRAAALQDALRLRLPPNARAARDVVAAAVSAPGYDEMAARVRELEAAAAKAREALSAMDMQLAIAHEKVRSEPCLQCLARCKGSSGDGGSV